MLINAGRGTPTENYPLADFATILSSLARMTEASLSMKFYCGGTRNMMAVEEGGGLSSRIRYRYPLYNEGTERELRYIAGYTTRATRTTANERRENGNPHPCSISPQTFPLRFPVAHGVLNRVLSRERTNNAFNGRSAKEGKGGQRRFDSLKRCEI